MHNYTSIFYKIDNIFVIFGFVQRWSSNQTHFLTIYCDKILDKAGESSDMQQKAERKKKEYFKQRQQLTGCAIELFLLSQVLARASKVKSMCDKNPTSKKGAKDTPQDLWREG